VNKLSDYLSLFNDNNRNSNVKDRLSQSAKQVGPAFADPLLVEGLWKISTFFNQNVW